MINPFHILYRHKIFIITRLTRIYVDCALWKYSRIPLWCTRTPNISVACRWRDVAWLSGIGSSVSWCCRDFLLVWSSSSGLDFRNRCKGCRRPLGDLQSAERDSDTCLDLYVPALALLSIDRSVRGKKINRSNN